MSAEPRLQRVPIDSVKQDPRNARKHSKRNLTAIRASLRRYGQQKPIVVGTDDVIIAGNGQHAAAVDLGWKHIYIVRSRLLGKEATAYALADNRTGELATWHDDVLAELVAELGDTDLLDDQWSDNELSRLLGTVEAEEDAAPDQVEQRAKPGDLWQCGDHRIICGDSTIAATRDRLLAGSAPSLMATDPPYGVRYDAQWRNSGVIRAAHGVSKGEEIAGDDLVDWSPSFAVDSLSVVYVWHAGMFTAESKRAIESIDYNVRAQIIWRKQHHAIGRGDYHWQHEPCWYAVKRGRNAQWNGDRKQTTVWDIHVPNGYYVPEGEERFGHATQKPVECMARPMRNHGQRGDYVYDPFSGSGTTIIAAEREQRRARCIEIDPRYVDMTLTRWEALTGGKAQRIGS